MDKRNGYIYKTTNKINGKSYIGLKIGEFDKYYYGSGKILIKAIKKYGTKNFTIEILENIIFTNKSDLGEKEKFYIKKYKTLSTQNGYNITEGGFGETGLKGKTFEEFYGEDKAKEIKEKMSKNRIGEKNGMFGKKHTKKTKQKISQWEKKSYIERYGEEKTKEILEKKRNSMLGKIKSIACREKMRNSALNFYKKNPNRQKGKNNGNYGKKHSGLNKGRKNTEETKKKISMSNTGKIRSEETKRKLRKLFLGKKHKKHIMSEIGREKIRESNRRRKIK